MSAVRDEEAQDDAEELDALRRRVAELEERLRETDERADNFARIVQSIDHHLYINEVLPDGGRRAIFVGPGRERLLGGVPEDGDWGRAWFAAVHPDDRAVYAEHTARYLRGEQSEVRCRMIGLDGVTRWIRGGGMPRRIGGRLIIEGIVRDATIEEHAEELLREASYTDALTGIANRRRAGDALGVALREAAETGALPGLLLLDVDHFKHVNDTYGHLVGDAVLVEVATRLRGVLRDGDLLARWGGEEFLVVIPAIGRNESLRAAAERLRGAVAASAIVAGDAELAITVSAGCALAEGEESPDELLERADRSLYAAKRHGRNRVRLYTELTADDLAPEEPDAIRLAQALSLAASVREGRPDMHSQQVADLAGSIAAELGLPADVLLRCRLGGWLHDIGKIAIPDAILGKPGPLDDAEWEVMRAHAAIGAEIVQRIATVSAAAPAVRHHHERFDGAGYPDALVAEQIPIEARVVAVADAFNAITSDRVYARGRSLGDALVEIRRCAGSHHDPVVVNALERVVDRRRTHTWRRLNAVAPG